MPPRAGAPRREKSLDSPHLRIVEHAVSDRTIRERDRALSHGALERRHLRKGPSRSASTPHMPVTARDDTTRIVRTRGPAPPELPGSPEPSLRLTSQSWSMSTPRGTVMDRKKQRRQRPDTSTSRHVFHMIGSDSPLSSPLRSPRTLEPEKQVPFKALGSATSRIPNPEAPHANLAVLATIAIGDTDEVGEQAEYERDAKWMQEEQERHLAYARSTAPRHSHSAHETRQQQSSTPVAQESMAPAVTDEESSTSDEFKDAESVRASMLATRASQEQLRAELLAQQREIEERKRRVMQEKREAEAAKAREAAFRVQLEREALEREQQQRELERLERARRQAMEQERTREAERLEARRVRLEQQMRAAAERAAAAKRVQQEALVAEMERERRRIDDELAAEMRRAQIDKERAKAARVAAAERERARLLALKQAEQERLAREQAEKARLAAQAEQERLAAIARAEQDRLAAQAEEQRLLAERQKEELLREENERERARLAAFKQEAREREQLQARRAENERRRAQEAERQKRQAQEAEKQKRQVQEAEKQKRQAAMEREEREQRLQEEQAEHERRKKAWRDAEMARMAEEKAAQERALAETDERAQLEAEERARAEADERARAEADERAQVEAEEHARDEAEERARAEAEEHARVESDKHARAQAHEPVLEKESSYLAQTPVLAQESDQLEFQAQEAAMQTPAMREALHRSYAAREAREAQRQQQEGRALRRARREAEDEDRMMRAQTRRSEDTDETSSVAETELSGFSRASDATDTSRLTQILKHFRVVSQPSPHIQGILSETQTGTQQRLRFDAPKPVREESIHAHPALPWMTWMIEEHVPRARAPATSAPQAPVVKNEAVSHVTRSVRASLLSMHSLDSAIPDEGWVVRPAGPYRHSGICYLPGYTVHGLAEPMQRPTTTGELLFTITQRKFVQELLWNLDFCDIRALYDVSRGVRRMLQDPDVLDTVLRRFLGPIGYTHGASESPSALTAPTLTLLHAEGFLMYLYGGDELFPAAHAYLTGAYHLDRRIPRLARTMTRSYNRVLAHVRMQTPKATGATWEVYGPGGMHALQLSSLVLPGVVSMFQAWAPTSPGWAPEVQRVERELFVSGVWRCLCKGDVAINMATGSRFLFDGEAFEPLATQYDLQGHLPAWINVLQYPPTYFDPVLPPHNMPAMYMDIRPWRDQIIPSLQLVRDNIERTGANRQLYRISKWVYRAVFTVEELHPSTPDAIPSASEAHPAWNGTVTIDVESTAEYVARFLERCRAPSDPDTWVADVLAHVLQGTNATLPVSRPPLAQDPEDGALHPYYKLRDRCQPGLGWFLPA
ncbi:hypothetical protein MNAN1_002118 [Malassezia nana]|uniref:Uncharacterized protein n=1 Tax=Malassezia nana TaxID=180528 RepID=A0AAF0ERW2_9BASI|nr:hypothetical protein MNAN1_002118 [Malassezia nana]